MTTETDKLRESVCIDVEAMLTACVPGGSIADPQTIADAIRAWVADQPAAQEAVQRVIDKALALITDSEEIETADGLVQAAQLYRWHELEDAIEKVGPAEVLNYTRPAERAAVPDGQSWQHAANEWADAATNGIQYLKNVRDGICSFDEAIMGLQGDIAHARDSQPPIAAKVEG